VLIDDVYCGASAIENDPDIGCMTYTSSVDTEVDDRREEEEDEFKADDWSLGIITSSVIARIRINELHNSRFS